MRIYLAGPMSGMPRFNFPAFDAAAADLRAQGWEVISPAELDDAKIRSLAMASVNGDVTIMPHTWGEFLSRDVRIVVDEVEAIAFLPGWEESRGARLEAYAAYLVGHRFYSYDPTVHSCLVPFGPGGVLDVLRYHEPQPEPEPSESVLVEAEHLVNGDRGSIYGHPYDDFSRSAQMMSAVLGTEVRPDQVPLLMIAVKLSRLAQSPLHRDSVVDIGGYAACWEKTVERMRQRGETG